MKRGGGEAAEPHASSELRTAGRRLKQAARPPRRCQQAAQWRRAQRERARRPRLRVIPASQGDRVMGAISRHRHSVLCAHRILWNTICGSAGHGPLQRRAGGGRTPPERCDPICRPGSAGAAQLCQPTMLQWHGSCLDARQAPGWRQGCVSAATRPMVGRPARVPHAAPPRAATSSAQGCAGLQRQRCKLGGEVPTGRVVTQRVGSRIEPPSGQALGTHVRVRDRAGRDRQWQRMCIAGWEGG